MKKISHLVSLFLLLPSQASTGSEAHSRTFQVKMNAYGEVPVDNNKVMVISKHSVVRPLVNMR